MTAAPWWTRTACRQLPDTDADAIFYPANVRSYNGVDVYAAARPYCDACPVVAECLTAALEEEVGAGYPHGFRGGRTPRQRVDIRRAQVRVGVA